MKITPPVSTDDSYEVSEVRTIHAPNHKSNTKVAAATPQMSAKDPAYIDLTDTLPSKFRFYSFDHLSIRPFKWGELKKVYKAVVSKDFRTLAEAVNATIDQSVFELSVGDFWFLMYWLRMNSFKKAPFTIKWVCENENHHLRIRLEELQSTTLEQEYVANMSNVKILFADGEKISEYVNSISEEHNMHLYPATVADMVESAKMLDADADPGDLWLSKYAANISRQYGATLTERMKYLENGNVPTDLESAIDEFIEISNHGVVETVSTICSGCGASSEITVSVDALSFFPRV